MPNKPRGGSDPCVEEPNTAHMLLAPAGERNVPARTPTVGAGRGVTGVTGVRPDSVQQERQVQVLHI